MARVWDELANNLGVWRRGSERAVHKPLLTLVLLARAQRGESRRVSFHEVDGPLMQYLREFGPSRNSYHPEYPFWYLQNDGFWEVRKADELPRRKNKDQPSRTALLQHDAVGWVPASLWKQLTADPALIRRLARSLLSSFWPETYHDDIAQAVGIDLGAEPGDRRPRDPEFRDRVLRAYEYRCAVCGLDVRVGGIPVALEAAHIQWYQAGGPDSEQNGLALCTLHHKLFDRGAFTIEPSGILKVSEDAHGTSGFKEWLLRFHGKALHSPQRPDYEPGERFCRWHVREVFHGPSRYLVGTAGH